MKNLILLAAVLFSVNISAQTTQDILDAFNKSYQLESDGEYKQAADAIKKAYKESSYEINLRLGWLNYKAGLFNESVSHYQRALILMPFSEEAKFGLVYPLSSTGKWDEVVILYDKILDNNPQNTVANYRLGLIFYGKEKYVEAEDYFKRIVDLYPFDYNGLLMYAWTNFKLGKTREAKVLFNKVLMNTPGDESAIEGLKLVK